jgi:hypothetical protein
MQRGCPPPFCVVRDHAWPLHYGLRMGPVTVSQGGSHLATTYWFPSKESIVPYAASSQRWRHSVCDCSSAASRFIRNLQPCVVRAVSLDSSGVHTMHGVFCSGNRETAGKKLKRRAAPPLAAFDDEQCSTGQRRAGRCGCEQQSQPCMQSLFESVHTPLATACYRS